MSKTQAPDPAQAKVVQVPVEPTPEMLAAIDSSEGDTITDPRAFAKAVWKDMLAAAPAIPAPEGGEQAAFEAYMRREHPGVELRIQNLIGTYTLSSVDSAWEGWQARAALAAPAPQAPRALTRDEVDELFADGLGFEPKGAIVREIVAEFCRVNGIPAPQTKEPGMLRAPEILPQFPMTKEPTNDR